jgi:hypothetical protein
MQALRCHLFCAHSYNISACMDTDEGGFQYSINMWLVKLPTVAVEEKT